MTRLEKWLLAGAGPVLLSILAIVIWPPIGDHAAMAGIGQALATLYAVVAALLIAANDRRLHAHALVDTQDAERRAFARRRDYDEAGRLLQFVETDRRAFEAAPGSRPRSPGAAPLILATWAKRNWWGTAVDYYVES